MDRPPAFSVCVCSAGGVSRRSALQGAGATMLAACGLLHPPNAYALKPGTPSKSKLLNRAHEDLTPEQIAEEKERQAEERKARLERQKELEASAERRKQGLETQGEQTDMEANLRASYYYPQARKRYLPRVRRAYESLPRVDTLVQQGEWSAAQQLAAGALNDAVLPMQLYASSLGGQGLSLAPRFVQRMDQAAESYAQACKRLESACKKKDANNARASVRDMLASVQTYRAEGKLEAEDFGIGEVPKDNRVGSGFGNNNPSLYQRNFSSILDQ